MTVPVQRRTVGTVLNDHDQRILRLERETQGRRDYAWINKTTDQGSIPSSTYTAVTNFDTGNAVGSTFSIDLPTGIISVAEDCWCVVTGSISWTQTFAAEKITRIIGTIGYGFRDDAVTEPVIATALLAFIAPNDFSLRAWQASGVDRTVGDAVLQVVRVADYLG